jgi:biotin-(acetyl-CoA carboxylase) ligase
LLLATDPELVARFAGREPHPRPVPAESLAPEDRPVWAALGQEGRPAWICAAGLPAGAEGWRRVFLVREAPRSQFDALRELLGAGGPPEGPVAAVAFGGSGFHGHRGRSWSAVEGNLHLCAVFAPPAVPARHGVRIVMLPAVAVTDALRGADAGLAPGIKWVNDILLEGRKVAGVLSVTQSRGERLESVLLGIGLNVERTPEVAGTPFVPGVVSLREAAGERAPDLPRATWLVLGALERRYRQLLAFGPDALHREYRRDSVAIGRRVVVYEEGIDDTADPATWPAPIARGLLADIAPDLTLRIAGRAEPVDRGRLILE